MQVEKKKESYNSKGALEAMFRQAGSSESSSKGIKRKFDEANIEVQDDSDDEKIHDEVRLWEDGFKDRYYESKFDVGPDQLEFR